MDNQELTVVNKLINSKKTKQNHRHFSPTFKYILLGTYPLEKMNTHKQAQFSNKHSSQDGKLVSKLKTYKGILIQAIMQTMKNTAWDSVLKELP